MKDIEILFSMVSQFAGVAVISISLFINYSNRKRALEFFIGLIFSFFLIQNAIIINNYINQITGNHKFLQILSNVMDVAGTALSSFFGLFLVNYLLGREVTRLKKDIFVTLTLVQFSGIILKRLNYGGAVTGYLVKALLISIIAYELLTALLNYKQTASKDLKRAIRIFGLITLIFFPFFILEAFRTHISWLNSFDFLKILALPAYFFVINIFSLIFAVTYFNSPAFFENNKLTDYFKKKFNITEKESEVIELLVQGLTYRQIAERLFVANKTIDNHVQNIYKKLEVTSKIQLSNLVRSKEK